MSDMIDYGRFADRLLAVRPRWDLYREFHEEWGYEVPEGGPSWPRWSEDKHKAYVQRLRGDSATGGDDPFDDVDLALPIPKALDEWWDLPFNSFTHTPRLYWTNPVYPPTVRPDPSGYGISEGLPEDNPFIQGDDLRVCIFKAENQYCNEWGYLAAEAGQEDPRVLVSVDDEGGWALQARSISEFFLLLAVQRLPTSLGWVLEFEYDDLEGETPIGERLDRTYREMGLLPWRELGADTHAYGGPDVIVLHDRKGTVDYPLVIAGRTRAAPTQAADLLGLKWSDDLPEPPSTPS
ncbi:hypothetical protein [Actinomadura luteofluorescens]|uniref:hypothetical protein n=1 Tax=Actinomadura luteofluorescens TaxID=46163 RepID=UPI003D8F0195